MEKKRVLLVVEYDSLDMERLFAAGHAPGSSEAEVIRAETQSNLESEQAEGVTVTIAPLGKPHVIICPTCGAVLEAQTTDLSWGDCESALCRACGMVIQKRELSVRDDFESAREAVAMVYNVNADDLDDADEYDIPAEVVRWAELDDAERAQGSPGVMAAATDEELGITPEEPLEGYDPPARYVFRGVEFVGRQRLDEDGTVFRLTPEEAARLVREHGHDLPVDVMCKEYGDDEDWVGMLPEELREDGRFDPDYETFELWLRPLEAAQVEFVSAF